MDNLARQAAKTVDLEGISSPRLFIRLLRNHRMALVASFGIGALLAALYAWSKPDVFIARAIIMPRGDSQNKALAAVMGQLGNMPGVGSLMGGMNANQETTQFQILLRTDFLASKVLEIDNLNASLTLDQLKRNFSIRVEGPAIHLQYRSFAADLSARVVQGYLTALQSFLNTNIVTQSRNAEVFVGERLTELTKQVDQAESHLSALRLGQVRPNPGRSVQSETLRAEREFQRLAKLSDLLSQQYELSRIEAKREDPMFLLVEPPKAPLKASGPHRPLLTVGGALVALLGTLLFLILRRKWNELVRDLAA